MRLVELLGNGYEVTTNVAEMAYSLPVAVVPLVHIFINSLNCTLNTCALHSVNFISIKKGSIPIQVTDYIQRKDN